MIIDRAVAAVLLAGLLARGLPAAGQQTYRFNRHHEVEKVETKEEAKKPAAGAVARALAGEVQQVKTRFAEKRGGLQILRQPGIAPGYLSEAVTRLIVDTREDLDQAIQSVQPSGSEPLRAWVNDKFQQIQGKIPSPGLTASLSGTPAPRALAVFASLRGFGLPVLAAAKPPKKAPAKPKPVPPKAPQPPQPQTIPTATADLLLDKVGEVVSRIFLLADHDDLEVKLWVGSEPAKGVTFRYWPRGNIAGSAPAPAIIRTNGNQDHVWRGLYDYSAAWTRGSVTEWIQYPNPAGAPAAQQSERLDLVKGSSFFCCRFDEPYCHHVASEKECRR